MTEEEILAYEGEKFSIEWYRDATGISQPFEYFMDLDVSTQNKLFHLFKRIGDFGRISDETKFRYEGDQIYAFKPKPDRFLCFFQRGKKIIVTNAFRKKQDKMPKPEKERSLNCQQDYLKRLKKGEYYDDN